MIGRYKTFIKCVNDSKYGNMAGTDIITVFAITQAEAIEKTEHQLYHLTHLYPGMKFEIIFGPLRKKEFDSKLDEYFKVYYSKEGKKL